jgi:hypothetical protein
MNHRSGSSEHAAATPEPPTSVQLEAAITAMWTAMWEYEQALWDADNYRITETRRALSAAIKDARRKAAFAARYKPDLAACIGNQDTPAPTEVARA